MGSSSPGSPETELCCLCTYVALFGLHSLKVHLNECMHSPAQGLPSVYMLAPLRGFVVRNLNEPLAVGRGSA